MGNYTKSGIWGPDEDDTMDIEVIIATQNQSIEDGIGERLEKQESRVSLRATTPDPFEVTGTGIADAYVPVPLTVGPVTNSRAPQPDYAGGNHADGITMTGNAAIVVTSGLYTMMGQLTTLAGTHAVHSWDFYGTVNGEIFGLPAYGTTDPDAFSGGYIFDTRQLVEGDRIELVCGVGTDHVGGFRVQDALLSVTMHYAT